MQPYGCFIQLVSLLYYECFIFQLKLWNSAVDKTNYIISVVTENVDCQQTGFHVYGEQRIPSKLAANSVEENLHFVGTFESSQFESKTVNNNVNECMFRHWCQEFCYYVYIHVHNVPNNLPWKICEISFH